MHFLCVQGAVATPELSPLSFSYRCPAWCDRITMNESALNVVNKVSGERREVMRVREWGRVRVREGEGESEGG